MAYRPRRANLARYLQGAPEYVLSVHDNPKMWDRYTVFFGGSHWFPELGRDVEYLSMSDSPTHPQGFSQMGQCRAADRDASGRKVRWLDLPEHIRRHVVYRAGYADLVNSATAK